MIKFQELRDADIPALLDDYGMKYTITSRKNANFVCPFHSDKNPSCGMHIETGLWKCFGCGEEGNIVTFVSKLDHISLKEAEEKIRKKYINKEVDPLTVVGTVQAILNKTANLVEVDPTYPDWILSKYSRDWSYMHGRGFKDETLEYFNVVYDPISRFQGFPCYDLDGRLVGVTGRNTQNAEPRYFPLIRFRKSHFVYNLHNIDRTKPVIAVEGEINCMAMHQHGFPNTVAFLGAGVSNDQIEVIKNAQIDNLILFFDSDLAGEHGSTKIISSLWTYMKIKTVKDHEGDPADLDTTTVKMLVESAEDFVLDFA